MVFLVFFLNHIYLFIKVTFVNNLELFGINAADFGKECQHGVAASTSVSKPPGKKCEQLLIQGNQVAFVGKLLTGKYGSKIV